jgi:hypothetical protein
MYRTSVCLQSSHCRRLSAVLDVVASVVYTLYVVYTLLWSCLCATCAYCNGYNETVDNNSGTASNPTCIAVLKIDWLMSVAQAILHTGAMLFCKRRRCSLVVQYVQCDSKLIVLTLRCGYVSVVRLYGVH